MNPRESTFRAAAESVIADASSLLPAEAATFSTTTQAYSQPFIERCAAAADDTRILIDVKAALRKIKGFSVKDFSKLLQDEVKRMKSLSRSNGNGHSNGHAPAVASPAHAGEGSPAVNILDHLLNDHGNACRIADLYGADLRYCYDTKCWLVWDGMRWAVGDIGQARQLAKQTMLEFLRVAVQKGNHEYEKFAKESLDVRRINAMLSMLESDLPIRAVELDTSPWLLNCLNGTVDLRKAALSPHDRADYITRLVHYPFDPTATCPLWEGFLDRAMGGNPDLFEEELNKVSAMVGYLQRMLGYSLTGSTSEKAVFIPFGEGNNGKSTMLTIVREIAIEYSVLIQVETLMMKQDSSTAQEDLAKLRGARFVQTSETEEGQRLSQGKLKRITQGMGDITATRKYEHSITFPETHKLFIDTNRRPEIRDAEDQATFKRLHPIPFNVTIPDDQIDRRFPSKLMGQAVGILAWIVRGANLWYRDQSLCRPKAIDDARDEWQGASAQINRFLQECAIPANGKIDQPGKSSPSKSVYSTYKNWCLSGNEKPFPSPIFVDKLKSHGFPTKKENTGNFVVGLVISLLNSEGDNELPFDDGSNRRFPDSD